MGIRISEEEEYQGVDQSECGLEAYPEFTTKYGTSQTGCRFRGRFGARCFWGARKRDEGA
jgi:hypothetical protein